LVAVILISRYQRPLQKIKMGCTSLLQPIRSHKTAHTDCVFVVARGASVGSFLSLLYVSLTTHADPYEATLSLSLSRSLSLSYWLWGGRQPQQPHRRCRAAGAGDSTTGAGDSSTGDSLLLPPARRPSSRASWRAAAAGSCPRATRGSPATQRRWSSTRSR
jgi:hypothetical protein